MKKDDEPPSGFCEFFSGFNLFSNFLLKGGPAIMEGEDEE